MTVSLHTSALAAMAHDEVFPSWLENAARIAARTRQPVAVLVPLRADAYTLKARALASGMGLFGIHFLTPGKLRDILARHVGLTTLTPLREHLRLLLATAAERVGKDAAPIAASPDQLLKAIDLIGAGGWSFSEAGPARLRPIVAEFHRLLDAAGFSMMHDADRALLAAAPLAPPLFSGLFVTGFNALHWPLWPLLEAAVRSAESATVCLTDPRTEAEDLDAAWIGTWEQTFGAAQPIASDRSDQSDLSDPSRTTFLVGRDTAEQAQAIVAQALQFLADPACERLGVLFPAAGALPRRVAALLAEHDIPHHDGLAHRAPGDLENAAWPAWLALQESPRLPALLRFLRTSTGETFLRMDVEITADELQRAYQEILIDDLAVLAAHLARHSDRHHAKPLAAALDALPFLPDRATLANFLERSRAIFRDLGWKTRADELQRHAEDWRGALPLPISRHAWLRWLGETLISWRADRAPAGAHPYSRLHLLPYAQAESQSWTHLIAAGLNEGKWPPPLEDSGFIGEEEIDALNRRLRELNTRATTQGRQGEGHIAVQPGKAFCLGPAQRRTLVARQFFNTLESATVALAVTAQLHDEAAPERPFNAGEFFAHLYFHARGRAIAQDTMTALHAETARWLDASGLWKKAAPDLAAVQSTRRAHDARRSPGQPFGEFEFALINPPQPPLRLAAKRWENAIKSPAEVWLHAVLGVSSKDGGDETPWALAQGNWVHDWLRAIAGNAEPQTFAPLPAPAEISARVRAAATAFRDRVTATLATQRRALPDWWASAWEQALGIATALAEGVARVPGRTHAAVEWKLSDTGVPLAGDSGAGVPPAKSPVGVSPAEPLPRYAGETPAGLSAGGTPAPLLRIRGRIDLLLTTAASIEDAWLVDYKTGHRAALRTRDLARGDGVQLALYALALREAGARAVGLSLLTPGAALDAPQLTLTDLDTLDDLWRGLLQMQETGVFGMRGALREEYSFHRDYPLATLAIDEEILAEKWALTHRDLAGWEEES